MTSVAFPFFPVNRKHRPINALFAHRLACLSFFNSEILFTAPRQDQFYGKRGKSFDITAVLCLARHNTVKSGEGAKKLSGVSLPCLCAMSMIFALPFTGSSPAKERHKVSRLPVLFGARTGKAPAKASALCDLRTLWYSCYSFLENPFMARGLYPCRDGTAVSVWADTLFVLCPCLCQKRLVADKLHGKRRHGFGGIEHHFVRCGGFSEPHTGAPAWRCSKSCRSSLL